MTAKIRFMFIHFLFMTIPGVVLNVLPPKSLQTWMGIHV